MDTIMKWLYKLSLDHKVYTPTTTNKEFEVV